jgi:dTMP kinase
VAPALAQGAFVLCDRFADSTEAYQSAGRGLDAALVASVDARVRDGLLPDLTLLYDLDAAEGLARAKRRDAALPGRFEAEGLALHERVRGAFLAIARREPQRVALIPVEGDAQVVFGRTWDIVWKRFDLR